MKCFRVVLCAWLVCFLLPSLLSAAEPIRVLTFNILYSRWDKPEFRWEDRKPIIVDVMKNYPDGNGPYDFIGTQETANDPEEPKHHMIDYLVESMPGYKCVYAPCNGRSDKYSLTNLLFYKADRWEIDPDDSGTFWLSSTPEKPGSNDWVENNRGGQRNVSYGLFHEIDKQGKRTGKKVYFFNTHLNVFVADARTRSAILIMDRIANRKAKDAAVLLTGDMNSLQDTPIIGYFQGASMEFDGKTWNPPQRLIETFKAVHPDSKEFGTSHGYTGKIRYDRKIDYIFASEDLKPVSAKVIYTKKGDLYPSDHLPVEAVLEWK